MNRIASEKREGASPARSVSALGLCALLLFGQTAPLLANPTGGAVVAGAATIGSAGTTLTINQSTENAIINWQQFSIAGGELTKFIVPNSSSATLNRVVGGNPSAIYGTLQSNGALYLVNPSGIVVGPNGRIDTAGFMGSTLDVSDRQFLKRGDLNFVGSSGGAIDNEGTIRASSGDVYLIANQVTNDGAIRAKRGTVGLAAGTEVLFQQSGTQHLFVKATPAGAQRATGVTNTGTIRAAAAELKAAGGNAYALAINNTGVIAATGYKKINGQVYLTSDGGSMTNSGKISARTANGNGGTIVMEGTARKSATSGTVINSGVLNASATVAGGKGGTVTVKNMGGVTIHSGQILAQGGQGGAGGNAEVSGKTLRFTGLVDLTATGGTTGTLLLDPATLEVVAGGSGTVSGGQNDSSSTEIDPLTVETALASANLTLNADTSVVITDGITWTSTHTLTLSLNGTGGIVINAPISGANGGLTLNAGAAGTIGTGSAGSVNVANFILQNGSWTQNSASLPAFVASHDFELQNSSTFLRVTGGSGSSGSPYQIVDVYGLQGIGSPSKMLLPLSFQLQNDIDASGTVTWNGGKGFVPIGKYDYINSSDSNAYVGTFDGQGHTIDGLFINLPNNISGTGLFGDTATGSTLEHLALTNANITGSTYTGAVAGVSNSTVIDVTSSGTVTGGTYTGGLFGITSGAISNSSVSGTVASDYGDVGGMVGYQQYGSIASSFSTATINAAGAISVGGLVGVAGGSITTSYSSGTVNAVNGTDVGGLVGSNENGTITLSYSTGNVFGGESTGGLIGLNVEGGVYQVYSTGAVSGTSADIGGLIGYNDGPVSNAFSAGAVTANAGSTDTGGLFGYNEATVVNSYTTSSVTVGAGSTDVGGFAGENQGTISDSYWDTTTAGSSVVSGVGSDSVPNTTPGVTGVTTTQLASPTFNPPNWDFSNVWTRTDANTPQLIGLPGAPPPGGASGTFDTLNGTAYSDGGSTIAPLTTIDLIFDGSLLGSTTTNDQGAFSFSISSADLTGGILLTDANDHGNTYYQSNSPTSIICTVDLWGGTLRIMADAASNTALAQAAGSLSGAGINYTVGGTNLTTNTGVSLSILSAYTLDGNVTAKGHFSTESGAVLTGTSNVTLTGTGVNMAGTFNLSGSLGITSTAGPINLSVGTSSNPATAHGITLNSAGNIDVDSSYLATAGGDFTATGTGYTSTDDAIGNDDGITIWASTIDAQGGNINLTGSGGYDNVGCGLGSGFGIAIDSSSSCDASTLETCGTGNISLQGTFNQNVSVGDGITGVSIYGAGNTLRVARGTISITGKVLQGTAAGRGNNSSSIAGIEIGGGALVEATEAGGSITMTGDASGGNSVISGCNFSFTTGIEIGGDSGPSTVISVVGADAGVGGTLTLNGTGANIDTTNSTSAGNNTPFSSGVILDNDADLSTCAHGTVSITGTGGSIVTRSAYTGSSEGVGINSGVQITMGRRGTLGITGFGGAVNAGNGANAADASTEGIHLSGSLVLDSGGTIHLTGTGGSLNTSQASPISGNDISETAGLVLDKNSGLVAYGSTTVTLLGTGGAVTSGEGLVGASFGVDIGSDSESEPAVVSSDSGLIKITGDAGAAPSLGIGVVVHGFNGGAALIDSTNGSIVITGTGGSGYTGDGVVTGNYIPNHGVAIVDNSVLAAGGCGSITLTGTGGANSTGVDIEEFTGDSSLDSSPVLPTVAAGGTFSATALSGTGVDVNGNITAANVTLGSPGNTSGPLRIIGSNITLSGGVLNAFGSGGARSPNGMDLTNSTIDTQGGSVNLYATGGTSTIDADISGTLSLSGGDFILDQTPSLSLGTISVHRLTVNGDFRDLDLGPTSATFLTLNNVAAIDQTGPLDTSLLSVSFSAVIDLTNPDNHITGLGNVYANDTLNIFTSSALTISGLVSSYEPLTLAETGGNMTIASSGAVSIIGGGNLVLAAGTNLANSGYFINNSSLGAGAVQDRGGRISIYSSDPTYDQFGGISFAPANMVYNAVYPTSSGNFEGGDAALFYVAAAGDVGPNAPSSSSMLPSTATGGAGGGGSNIVPPALTPQPIQVADQTSGTPGSGYLENAVGSTLPPFRFTGSGGSTLLGQEQGGLADSSSNSGLVGTGDVAQLGNGQLNNVSNPRASGLLNEALGPIVYQNLADALKDLGDWAGPGDSDTTRTAGEGDETILSGGDVAEMSGAGVKSVPSNQVPDQLRDALGGDVQKRLGSGH